MLSSSMQLFLGVSPLCRFLVASKVKIGVIPSMYREHFSNPEYFSSVDSISPIKALRTPSNLSVWVVWNFSMVMRSLATHSTSCASELENKHNKSKNRLISKLMLVFECIPYDSCVIRVWGLGFGVWGLGFGVW